MTEQNLESLLEKKTVPHLLATENTDESVAPTELNTGETIISLGRISAFGPNLDGNFYD